MHNQRSLSRSGGEQFHRLFDAFENCAGVDEVGGAETNAADFADGEPEREVSIASERRKVEPRHRPQCPNGQRLALLGFSRLASAAVCLPLTWITAVQYPLYASAPRAYNISAINDQHLAGASMCFIEFLVFGIAFAAVFISMLGRDESRVTLAEHAAGH